MLSSMSDGGLDREHYEALVELLRVKNDLEQKQAKLNLIAPQMFSAILAAQGLTQRDLSETLDINYTYTSKIVNGSKPPGLPVWERLLTYLQSL